LKEGEIMKKLIYLSAIILVTIFLSSCKPKEDKNIVTVTAKDFSFESVNEISSGWTTFKFKNEGHAEHFFLLNHLPDSISFNMYLEQVSRPFDVVFDSLKAGMSKSDAINLLVKLVPSWYFTSVKAMGGSGIVAAGKTSQTTLSLIPGTYSMECYIKEKGIFHTSLGMIKAITVIGETSDLIPPEANVDINLTNSSIATEGEVEAGMNTIAVHFKEHAEAGLGNDIHLIRMNDDTDIDEVLRWMDWTNITGLEPPAPAEFFGGTQEMPIGYTSYFTVDLEPGKYAFITESMLVPGMAKTFTVE
jgi:hypothetical protein